MKMLATQTRRRSTCPTTKQHPTMCLLRVDLVYAHSLCVGPYDISEPLGRKLKKIITKANPKISTFLI